MAERLIDIVPEKFKEGMTEGERYILQCVQDEQIADLGAKFNEDNDPANFKNWNPERIVCGELLRWLITDKKARKHIPLKGIDIKGAWIDGGLDLECAEVKFRFSFINCKIDGEVNLRDASTRTIEFDDSHLEGFIAENINVNGSVFFRKANVQSEVLLLGAHISGQLNCTGAEFKNKAMCFIADGMKVGGTVLFFKVMAYSEFRLLGANIGGQLNCEGAVFMNEGVCFGADYMKVRGSVIFYKVKANGQVRFLGAHIGGQLACQESVFSSKGTCFVADRMKVVDNVFLSNVKSLGEFTLAGADIGGQLICNEAVFINAKTVLELINDESSEEKLTPQCFTAGEIKVGGYVSFSSVKAYGIVWLQGAEISGLLDCTGAEFKNEKGKCFIAENMKVGSNVYFRGVKAKGEVWLQGADISGQLDCTDAVFESDKVCFSAQKAHVKRCLILNKASTKGLFDLSYMKVSEFEDEVKSWPVKLVLTGFVYDDLYGNAAKIYVEDRIKWIRRSKDFSTQPYEQLAKVYRTMGREHDAREVLYAKHEDLRVKGGFNWLEKLGSYVKKITMGHGYKPHYALAFMLSFFLTGTIIFCSTDSNLGMIPSKERVYMDSQYALGGVPPQYPEFNSLIYSIDSFVPFVDLHQEDYWLPDVRTTCGSFARVYLWLHILIGWFFSAIVAASLTGLIKKE